MPTVADIFQHMSDYYRPGVLSGPRSYYFSVGEHKYTVRMTAEACTVEPGNTVGQADCVLKTTPTLFERIVLHGKLPGPLDIARGRFKTNDVAKLKQLMDLFDFSAAR